MPIIAVHYPDQEAIDHPLLKSLRRPEDDYVYRMKVANAMRTTEKIPFVTEDVTIDIGPKNQKIKVTVRWAQPPEPVLTPCKDNITGQVVEINLNPVENSFVFACIQDNKEWADRSRSEWKSAAEDALSKFAAVRGLSIVFGPRAEDGNTYNHMIEIRGAVK